MSDRKKKSGAPGSREPGDIEKAIINKYKRQRTFVLVICLLAVIWSVVSIINSRAKCAQIDKERKSYELKLQTLEEEKNRLQAEKEQSQSLEYIEKAAREKLKMIKPGEVLYMINDNSQKAEESKKADGKEGNEAKDKKTANQ